MPPSASNLLTHFKRFFHLTPLPLGARGERYAARYLKKQGMKIIARNRTLSPTLRNPTKGEIDLIAIDGNHLVFVEVRTRSSESFMTPEATIRFRHKQKTLIRSARRLIKNRNLANLTPRIDVIAIIWPKNAKSPTTLRHHKAALPIATR